MKNNQKNAVECSVSRLMYEGQGLSESNQSDTKSYSITRSWERSAKYFSF
jgi:hypothetical protein